MLSPCMHYTLFSFLLALVSFRYYTLAEGRISLHIAAGILQLQTSGTDCTMTVKEHALNINTKHGKPMKVYPRFSTKVNQVN